MTYYERRRLFWIFTVFFTVLALPVILYATGWRLTSALTFQRTGGLFVSADESEVEIFINGELEKRTNLLQTGLFLQGLTPGKISVIAAKEDYWPWAKELEIKESFVTETRAFLVPMEPKGEMLVHGNYKNIYALPDAGVLVLENERSGKTTFDYYKPVEKNFLIDATFKRSDFKSSFTDITDRRNKIRIRIGDDKREVLAEWIVEEPLPYFFEHRGETSVFRPKTDVRGIGFYPGRRDIILVAVENGVFALELDGRGTRNFQPVYKGKNPVFVLLENLIYILDDGRLFEVRI